VVQQQWGVLTVHDHRVGFYDEDRELVDLVAQFVADGRALGQPALLLMTRAHAEGLKAALTELGLDPAAEQASGGLVIADAEETLGTFLVDGDVVPERFAATIDAVLLPLLRDGGPARAFGEMVGLLWEQGNVTAALDLERLWTTVTGAHPVSLLCAYPSSSLEHSRLSDVTALCGHHSDLVPIGPRAPRLHVGSDEQDRLFVPSPDAVAGARRFVGDVLESWQLDQLVADATLVVSEIATNALKHAGTAFLARVSRAPDGVRIAIEDAVSAIPVAHLAGPEELHGRGLAIVEALSRRWGADAVPDGKVVWSELAITAD
jgi:anti-sigma regulatory factor (Ser/Thr protein kinase)